MTYFPDNTLAEYKVKLPNHVELPGKWEVGLASITFPHTWHNIREDDRRFYYDNGDDTFNVILLPTGYYSSISEVVDTMNEVMTKEGVRGISFQLDSRSQKVTIVLTTKKRLGFESFLGVLLGFGGGVTLTKTTTASHVSDINATLHSLYIYLNIVGSQIVGDVFAPLLRIVPTKGKNGDIITIQYDTPQYLPVTTKDFEILEVLLADETGKKIPFERGTVVLTLHFKLRRPSYF